MNEGRPPAEVPLYVPEDVESQSIGLPVSILIRQLLGRAQLLIESCSKLLMSDGVLDLHDAFNSAFNFNTSTSAKVVSVVGREWPWMDRLVGIPQYDRLYMQLPTAAEAVAYVAACSIDRAYSG